jgi:hypothetical protein
LFLGLYTKLIVPKSITIFRVRMNESSQFGNPGSKKVSLGIAVYCSIL